MATRSSSSSRPATANDVLPGFTLSSQQQPAADQGGVYMRFNSLEEAELALSKLGLSVTPVTDAAAEQDTYLESQSEDENAWHHEDDDEDNMDHEPADHGAATEWANKGFAQQQAPTPQSTTAPAIDISLIQSPTVWIGGIPPSFTFRDLGAWIEDRTSGLVAQHVHVAKDRHTGASRGHATVTFANLDDAHRAARLLHGVNVADLGGKTVFVRPHHAGGAGMRSVFVRRVPFNAAWFDVKRTFETAGFNVSKVDLIPRNGGAPGHRGYGTVALSSAEEAARAVEELTGAMVAGQPIQVFPFDSARLTRPGDKSAPHQQQQYQNKYNSAAAASPAASAFAATGGYKWAPGANRVSDKYKSMPSWRASASVPVPASQKVEGPQQDPLEQEPEQEQYQEQEQQQQQDPQQQRARFAGKPQRNYQQHPNATSVFIGNLPSGLPWFTLKDFLRDQGFMPGNIAVRSAQGKPFAYAIVQLFVPSGSGNATDEARQAEADRAIAILNGVMFEGNRLMVQLDRSGMPREQQQTPRTATPTTEM
ncbi:hypothetical protein AMAG_15987 [Allomyces macrogynus ATCC 38327]|uniref:RRM domain-containing protein n=1 Tax=Allomyces macrogynus (strain ATCC 38327) TaxID=578462 RepID=A0A0L0TBF6_ALLM3|nr:hypothetical protein AMAG_15987 [Allomyces macrogynus ATCC 38327]|eukprot:KNE72046.1 hypothetical protein AMAG_15987 [Allomyces macrogynus ATCC 38327]